MPVSNTSPNFMLWFAGVGGGDAIAYVSGDPATGGGNSGFGLTYILNNDPNLFGPRDIMLDTVHDRFFFVDSDISGGNNRIMQGSISQVLANPGAPVFTTLYSDPGTDENASIRALVLDHENGLVYFDHGTTLARISYDTALQTPTVLADLGSGNFITQLSIDFATGNVFLGSSAVFSFFGMDFVEDNYIYRASGLTPSSTSLSFSTVPFSPNDSAFGDPDVPAVPGDGFPAELGTIRGMDYDPLTQTLYISTATVTLDTSSAQDGSELTTYYGGVYAYATTGNPTGAYTIVYQQDGSTGPVGQLGFIEVDPSTGKYFVVDTTGGPAAGDGGVWVGSLSGGTPTLFATIGNPGDLAPQGIDIIHAPTLNGAETGASAVETAGVGSGYSAAVTPFASIDAGDLDSAGFTDQLAGAQVRISGGFNSAPGSSERLTIGGTTSGTLGSGISYSYNSLTGVMTLTGVNSFDNYEAALALVSYSINGDNPDADGAAPTRTISYSLYDGLLYSDEFDATVNVVGTNDGPVNTTGGPVSTSEDAASVAVTGLSVSDADDNALTVTLSVGRGTLTLASIAGLSFGTGDGTGDATMTFSGTAAAINAALAGLSYTPTANLNGADTLTMTTGDGTGSDSDNVSISVSAVNDAPTVAGDGTEDAAPIVQDTPSPVGQTVSSLFGGQYSDAVDQVAGGSSADAFAGVAVTANGSGASGQWQYYNGVTWVNIGAASNGAAVLLSASTAIRFNPAPGFSGAAPTLTAHLVDASGGALTSGAIVDASVTGGTTRYSTGSVVLSETVLAGNTAPTGVTGTLSVQEVSANGTLVGTLVAADPDSSTFTYTLVNDAGGRFDINSTTGAVTVENGLLLDYEQNASHTIRVRVNDNEGGISEFNVNVTVTDRHGELVIGDGANHIYYGGAETDILIGGHGADVIHGGGGIDIITGGNILFDPTDSGDQLFGEAGNDIIAGNGGDDVIAGGADSDVLTGEEGNDIIYGGASASDNTETGNDVISGDAGNDFLYGNGGNDTLYGGDNDDQLFGGAGIDVLDGGSGIDRLNGGAGADDLTGGAGFDVFIFKKGEANGDEIFDFDGNGNAAGDSIRLEGYAAGTSFTKVSGDVWKINDHGFIEYITIHAAEPVKTSDWVVVP
jgi:hypothetical protein